MQNNLIALFVMIPMVAGLISLALTGAKGLQRFLGVVSLGSMLLLASSLLGKIYHGDILTSQMGGWAAPYGISLIFDSLSGLLLGAGAMVALGCYIHSFSILDPKIERRYYHPLIQFLMCGVNLSFLTGDLFNLFVAFEIMLMSSYALLCLGSSLKQLRQAYKYVILNLVGSTLFVIAAGMVYGLMGTLNMADLMLMVQEANAGERELPQGFTAVAIMLLMVFALKGAFFPLWFWLPDTYYTCPISIAGLFGGMLTKVGVYAVVRTFPVIFAATEETRSVIQPLIAISALFTMFLGVLGAVSQHHVRRILSIHVISQVGYMVFGITIGLSLGANGNSEIAEWALCGVLFYMIQHMVVKSALFLCCGVMEKHAGSDDLNKVGGLLRSDISLAVLFFIAAMSLVGLPPLSGFFGKLIIIRAGWVDFWWLSMFGLITGGLTLLSMLKIWSYAFWFPLQGKHVGKDSHDKPVNLPANRKGLQFAYFGITLLVISALCLGIFAQPFLHIAKNAGRQLTDSTEYIKAVNPRNWDKDKWPQTHDAHHAAQDQKDQKAQKDHKAHKADVTKTAKVDKTQTENSFDLKPVAAITSQSPAKLEVEG